MKLALNNKEPTIAVGIILPEDNQKKLRIMNSQLNQKYEILIKNNQLLINNKFYSSYRFTRPENELNDHYFSIDSVNAGRGFHWEKKISIKVKGDLEIKIKEKSIFLVNYILAEMYLMCVATSEMSGDCPISLLESQTIAARSWLFAAAEKKHQGYGLDVCNDDCCQRYQGFNQVTEPALLASKNTSGKVLFYDNFICDTRYSKCCGGHSENNENVWGGSPKTYLKGRIDNTSNEGINLIGEESIKSWIKSPHKSHCNDSVFGKGELKKYLGNVDKSGKYFRWSLEISQNELTKNINEKTGFSFTKINSLEPIRRGVSGRILELRVIGHDGSEDLELILKSEYEIRRVLHPKFLYSSAFITDSKTSDHITPSNFKLDGAGWGHGVGLCQIGALKMALMGKSTNEILLHYFSSTEVKKIYD